MTENDRPPRWQRPLDPDEDGDSWFDDDEERPASLDRRRHRDPEETDERRESERRRHPRQLGQNRE